MFGGKANVYRTARGKNENVCSIVTQASFDEQQLGNGTKFEASLLQGFVLGG